MTCGMGSSGDNSEFLDILRYVCSLQEILEVRDIMWVWSNPESNFPEEMSLGLTVE